MSSDMFVKEVPITFMGKEHMLRYDLNAFIALEDKGYDFDAIVKMATQISFKSLGILLWAGIQHNDKKTTVDEINKSLTFLSMTDLFPIVGNAILDATPKETDEIETTKKK